jgi:hypothetical protein
VIDFYGSLKLIWQKDYVTILNNSSLHKTASAMAALDSLTSQRWIFCGAYCHDDKIIELSFRMVKERLRNNEMNVTTDPLGAIDNAFRYNSVDNPGVQGVIVL